MESGRQARGLAFSTFSRSTGYSLSPTLLIALLAQEGREREAEGLSDEPTLPSWSSFFFPFPWPSPQRVH